MGISTLWTDAVGTVEAAAKKVGHIASDVGNVFNTGFAQIGTAIEGIPALWEKGAAKTGLLRDVTRLPAPGSKTTPTVKSAAETKASTAKAGAEKAAKRTVDWQSNYDQDILSLLRPYQQAVGELPKEFEGYLANIEKGPASTLPHADEIVNQLAQPYGGTFGETPATSGLTGEEGKALATVEGGTKGEANALSELGKGMDLYMNAVPYEGIQKALLSHMQNLALYTGQLTKGAGWPKTLQDLYNVAIGGQVGSGLKVAGFTPVKTKKTTPTGKTTTSVPASGSGTGGASGAPG